jgi:uncharacterized repeat protein (TIGR01451 family)
MIGDIQHRLKQVFLMLGVLAALAGGSRLGAADFGLSVTGAPNPVLINRQIIYDIAVSNATGFEFSFAFVTNEFSAPVRFIGLTNNIPVTVNTNSNTVIIQYAPFSGIQTDLLTVAIAPLRFGSLTNTVTVAAFARTNAVTNVVIEVIAGQPDLAIAIAGPTQPILVNDQMTYTLAVSNPGSDAAPNVLVSNSLPVDFKFLGFAPSNQVVTFTNSTLLWTVGTLASGGFSNLNVTVQPTNAGLAVLSASVSAPNVLDTNTLNDATISNITVSPLITGSLVASNITTMMFNPQTGLMEQTVRLVNVSTNTVASARIIVSGLTNRLFNAVGTNGNDPFIVYGGILPAGTNVDLLFEYFIPTRLPIIVADSQLHPFEMPAANLAPPAGTPFDITLITNLSSGDILIEFKADIGRTYTVLYSTNAGFSNEMSAQPSIVAPADRVQWLDDGPPKTVSRPASVSSRYYRVIQNQ